jgi:hypothetical protein
VNAAVFAAGSPVLLKGLTGWGMVNAFILGTAVFAAFGAGGFGLVCVYFLFGTAVSVLGPRGHRQKHARVGAGFHPCSSWVCHVCGCMHAYRALLLMCTMPPCIMHPLVYSC